MHIIVSSGEDIIRNRNRKLEISAPSKVKSRELSYSQTLIQNKIDRPRYRESGMQAVSQTAMVFEPYFALQSL